MTIEEQVNEGIKNAMKAQDKIRLETMRNIKKVILEAKTRPGAGDHIEDSECIKLIQKLAKQGRESAGIYQGQGREDLYAQEMGQVAVLEEFLPKQLSEAELTTALKEIIASVGASSPQEMGKVMGVATKKLAGLADGKAISAKVKELLA
ncbi:GatB/YqeY domain-containing protein [Odoribacter sp. Z80]|uniref:GatB/YqeY domain-containing protein n=1 Tax=Odoribacter sp. Z80 TaxID=2304575 RepID=UPI00137AB393|nr:GatB/YqeY domain-containing protein [Odoribacter sp. Z80]NCE72803.1 GatB/YqeY domain-containing protein [Odoribacter sp. Z80]